MTHYFSQSLASISLFKKIVYKLTYPQACISRYAQLQSLKKITLSKNCVIAEHTLIKPVFPSDRIFIAHGCHIRDYCQIAGNVHIQDHTSLQSRSILLGDIAIGRYCLFAHNVYASSGTHLFKKSPHEYIRIQDAANHFSKKITIEDDCWIGANVVIMAGVTIGKGAVIGANAVVTHDVPPYAVMAGVPAKIISHRLDFQPPQHIDYQTIESLPYFYSGMAVEQKGANGIPVCSNSIQFSLSVFKIPSRLLIRGHALTGASLTASIGTSLKQIPQGKFELSFNIEKGQERLMVTFNHYENVFITSASIVPQS